MRGITNGRFEYKRKEGTSLVKGTCQEGSLQVCEHANTFSLSLYCTVCTVSSLLSSHISLWSSHTIIIFTSPGTSFHQQDQHVKFGRVLPVNKFDEMESKGSTSRQQRVSSTTSRNQRLSTAILRSAENDANRPYENHALRMWTERRREWVGTREKPRSTEQKEPVISWSTTYEDLLGTSRPFAKPIPLPEMVDFLVDVWEQEGLYE